MGKKILVIAILLIFSACTPVKKPFELNELVIYGFPFLEPEVMLARSEPLKDLLKVELAKQGYNVEKVSIYIGTSQGAVAEALSAGSAQIGIMNSLTYLLFKEDDMLPILSALRGKLNIDSENLSDWNTLTPIVRYTDQLDSTYRNVILAGPSSKGQSLIAQLDDFSPLPWDEISTAKWCMPNPGNAGYIYGALWVYQTYGKPMSAIPNLTIFGGYHEIIQAMATLQCDVASMPMILRRDYQTRWQTDFNRSLSFLEEVKVIGLPPKTPNSLIVVNQTALNNDQNLINAIKIAFLTIVSSEEGKLALSPFSVDGLGEIPEDLFDADIQAIELLGLGRP